MARCTVTGEEFINFVFSPNIGVLTSYDVEDLCAPNNLSFVQLLLPFCSNIKDVLMKDGNNMSHMITKLHLCFHNAMTPSTKKISFSEKLKQSVLDSEHNVDSQKTVFKLTGQSHEILTTTPWFEFWRHAFINGLGAHEHEFLTRFLACIFVVSTNNPDVLEAFSSLGQIQSELSKNKSSPSTSNWFNSNIVKLYVLVNDPSSRSAGEADKIYQTVTATYGNTNCYLLNLSSRISFAQQQQQATSNGGLFTDPWLAYLIPHGCSQSLNSQPTNHDDKTSATYTKPHGQFLTLEDHNKLRVFVEDFAVRIFIPWVESTIKTLNEQTSHRLRKSRGFLSATRKFFSQATSSQLPPTAPSTPSLVSLDSQNSASGLGLASSSQSDTNLQGNRANHEVASSSSGVYADDAPEMQMRRLADLYFLLQLYEQAHQIYDALRKDFRSSYAWLHYAGVQEMAALSTFLQGTMSQRQYPQHQMDDAIVLYITKCKNTELAVRAVLLHTEALKSRNLFSETAVCFIRLADAYDYLAGGLLLEQAAHCCLRVKKPQIRHFAFRMALAGVRFARAKQPKRSYQCYSSAWNILNGRCWTLVEDHINENMAHQALLLSDQTAALTAYKSLILQDSKQLELKQAHILREFVQAMRKFSANEDGKIPELCLPAIEREKIKVMLGSPSIKSEDSPIEARGVRFSDNEHEDDEDFRLFVRQRAITHSTNESAARKSTPRWMLWTDFPALEDYGKTEQQVQEEEEDGRHGQRFLRLLYEKSAYPLVSGCVFRRLEALLQLHSKAGLQKLPTTTPCLVTAAKERSGLKHLLPVGEQLTIQIPINNPWRIPLVLTNVHLLWSASFSSTQNPDSSITMGATKIFITNETQGDQLRIARQYVLTENLAELCMLPGDKKMVELGLQMKQMGEICITGLAFRLHASSPHHSVDVANSVEMSDSGLLLLGGKTEHRSFDISASSQSLSSLDSASLASSSIFPQIAPISSSFTGSASSTESVISSVTQLDPLDFNPAGPHSRNAGADSLEGKALFSRTENMKDARFQWTSVRSMPLLRVSFESFPQQLFEGEICRHGINLTNLGPQSLEQLRFICSWPSFFVFDDPHSNCMSSSSSTSSSSSFIYSLPAVTSDLLLPNQTVHQSFWIRAPPNLSLFSSTQNQLRGTPFFPPNPPPSPFSPNNSSRRVQFVFGYAAMEPIYNVSNTRFLRHEADVTLSPSLCFTAGCSRVIGAKISSLILTVRCRNLSPQTSFYVTQLTSVSPNSEIELISHLSDLQGILVNPSQEVTVCLRAWPIETSNADAHVSNVTLGAQASLIDVSTSPFNEFFNRIGISSVSDAKENILQTDLQPQNISLIAFWRIASSLALVSRMGQSHIQVMSEFDKSSLTPLVASSTVAEMTAGFLSETDNGQTRSEQKLAHVMASVPSLIPLSSLVRLRLHHPSVVTSTGARHQSSPSSGLGDTLSNGSALLKSSPGLVHIPVEAELYNASSSTITVHLGTGNDISRTDVFPTRCQLPHVFWVGVCLRQFSLLAGETRRLQLTAKAPAGGGVFEVNSLSVKAAPSTSNDDSLQAPFVRQLCDFSSLVTVLQHAPSP